MRMQSPPPLAAGRANRSRYPVFGAVYACAYILGKGYVRVVLLFFSSALIRLAGELLFLASPRKSNQKEGDPWRAAAALRRFPALLRATGRLRNSAPVGASDSARRHPPVALALLGGSQGDPHPAHLLGTGARFSLSPRAGRGRDGIDLPPPVRRLLFGYFLLAGQQKVSRPQGRNRAFDKEAPFARFSPPLLETNRHPIACSTARLAIAVTRCARYSALACRSLLTSSAGSVTRAAAAGEKSAASASSIAVKRNAQDLTPVTATRTALPVFATNTPARAKRDAGERNFA